MGIEINKDNIAELIKNAFLNHEIKVYYQPKFNAVNCRIQGAEALARWQMSDGVMISPGMFVPLLEELGLIVELDWYMFEETCRFISSELKANRKMVTISANFSRLHAKEPQFAKKLSETADKFGVPRKYLEVEITESALALEGVDIIDFVSSIKDAGFAISIDDFGSGLSSLNFVKDVPATELKIDKSLLSHNCENEKERIVLEAIFEFAHRLNMTTVAEGVETKEQLGFLRTCGCELIQGFLFAKPMPEDDFRNALLEAVEIKETDDILIAQSSATATQLLMNAVFEAFPLVIMSNLTRNSFYMMAYDNFSTRSCPSTGIYTELIVHGASTMYPDDQKLFSDTFDINDQIAAYERGERTRRVITRQLGDDGIYRRIETTNYYMKNPNSDDILAVTLSRAVE